MTDASFSRRRLLATATALSAGALAGCFEEVDDPTARDGVAGEDTDENDGDEDGGVSGDGDDSDNGDESDSTETDTPTPTPDSVDPAESGLRVVETEYTVREDGWETEVEVEITVENVGEFTFGYIELRVDAYYSPPGRATEDAVGFVYAGPERFSGFSSGTRTFGDFNADDSDSVIVTFPASDADDSTDSDRFRVDAAVRRAEPE